MLSTSSNGRLSRLLNLAATIAWACMLPFAELTGWVNSVRFISHASIYANFASHLAAWRSDVNPNQDQLDRIEEKLDRLLAQHDL